MKEIMQKDIILFGTQGSGKGTQAKMLLERKLLKHKHFESGQILRALKSNDNMIGAHMREIINTGGLIDDEVIYKLFEVFMHFIGRDEYILSDGFLRTLNQMYYYLHKMHLAGDRDFIGIFYDIPREVAMERLLKRAEEQHRGDDTMDAIMMRLNLFEKNTLPVIHYLDKIGKIIRIDASKSVDEIFDNTCGILRL
ncbi:MAG: hypothetical protein CR971_02570 [candidate division SR1 bacterium]|nr:MAG: hypothetical protein CR971_02570 [candidate division SR1 bacterium]